MAYDYKNELQTIKKHYEGDPLQKRYSALVTGESNAGKTFLLRTARKPIHIDSFDPGGSKSVRDLIKSGDVIADTSWEHNDPFNPTAFANWMTAIERRIQIGYFEHFGTYCLDSATTWGEAIMAHGLKLSGKAGQVPHRNRDYMPQKIHMSNYINKLMRLPCDFILTGHLREIEEIIHIDKSTGIKTKDIKYRFYTVGQAVVTIPLLFDEIYVIVSKGETSTGPRRMIKTDALGKYHARSRLKEKGLLDAEEEPDLKNILKKAGYSTEDKPKLSF